MFMKSLAGLGESLASAYQKIKGQPTESADLGELPARFQARITPGTIPGSPESREIGVRENGVTPPVLPIAAGVAAMIGLGFLYYLTTIRRG